MSAQTELGAIRLAIRVDASSRIGMGHLKRCLSLATAWRTEGVGDVRFVVRAPDEAAVQMLRTADFHFVSMPAGARGLAVVDPLIPHAQWSEVPAGLDAEQTLSALADCPPDVVLVDHYAFDARWHDAVRRGTGARMVAIDDLGDRAMAVDLLIDHNLSFDPVAKYRGRLHQDGRLLCGPRFALIDPLYAGAAKAVMRDAVSSIGIFMGGADAAGMSLVVLEACRVEAGFGGAIEVASTSANPRLQSLREACSRWPHTTLAIDQPDLAAFFARHDLQIGAGGGASWERCCIGAPTLALVCAENQRDVVAELARRNAVATTPSLDPQDIGHAVAALVGDAPARGRLNAVASGLVDGHGCARAAVAIAAPWLALRQANIGDAPMAYQWRNDERTRIHFRDPSAVDRVGHIDWWRRTLANAGRALLVAECGSRGVGVLRFDFDGKAAEVSIYVDPLLSGLGVARSMLTAGMRWLKQNHSATLELRAHVLSANVPSRKTFEAAGFNRQTETEWKVQLRA